MVPLLLVLGVVGLAWLAGRGSQPGAFISFAAEDANIRDLFVGQSKHPDASWKLKDRSLHEPFSTAWKTQTKEIIQSSDVLIALIGEDTHRADGATWEIKTAIDLGIPVFGVYISKKRQGKVPECLKGYHVIAWSQKGIAQELERALKDR